MNLLEIKGLTKTYGRRKKALDNVNLNIKKGKIIGIFGANGSGKSTLLKIVSGLITSYKGEVLVEGNPISYKTKELISYLPDKSPLNPSDTIIGHANLYSDYFKDFDMELFLQIIEELNLDPKSKVKTLSKGNAEKVFLSLALARRSKLYLLDEPIGGIDVKSREFILDLILKNYNREGSLIITSHIINEMEKILDEVIFIKDGNIILHEDINSIMERTNMNIEDYFKEVC